MKTLRHQTSRIEMLKICMDGQCLKKLPVNGFKQVEDLSQFKENFIKNYHENRYFLEVDVEYPKISFNLHRDLPFLPDRKKNGKCNKLLCDFHNKKNYVVRIMALKQALNHGLILKKQRE